MKIFAIFIIATVLHVSLMAQQPTMNLTTGCDAGWFEGEGTHYGGVAGSAGGHCGIAVDSGDVYHAAMNHIQYDSSNACGTCVRILGPKGEVTLKIVDECPECKFGDIDVTTAVFPQLADMKDGRIKIRWQYVPCPLANDVTLMFAPGSGPYYFKAQLAGANYPVTCLEYRRGDGSFDTIHREVYNYYVRQGGIDEDKQKAGPYIFRFTASTGQVLYTDSVRFSTTGIVHTGVQFDHVSCPDCAGVFDGQAKVDNCGVCSGGTTGIAPNSTCKQDCAGYWDGTAYLDSCGHCVAGTTGLTPCHNDCIGVAGGKAYLDHCGQCVGGTSGREPCTKDCNNDWGGVAFVDSCGRCAGGNTRFKPTLDARLCGTTQSIRLRKGWNIISTNVVPDLCRDAQSCISTLFAGLDVQEIKNMDVFWRTGQMEGFNLLKTIAAGEGLRDVYKRQVLNCRKRKMLAKATW